MKDFFQSTGIAFSDELRQALYKKEWVVYAKRPFGGANQVIEYLGRYTHKIAISNHRIESIDNGKVIFTYKDYGDEGKVKPCPCCGKGEMHIIMSFGANSPPFHNMLNELKNNKLGQNVS